MRLFGVQITLKCPRQRKSGVGYMNESVLSVVPPASVSSSVSCQRYVRGASEAPSDDLAVESRKTCSRHGYRLGIFRGSQTCNYTCPKRMSSWSCQHGHAIQFLTACIQPVALVARPLSVSSKVCYPTFQMSFFLFLTSPLPLVLPTHRLHLNSHSQRLP